MEIPTLKRTQRLGYEQGGAPMDIGVAASKGRAIASAGETISNTAMNLASFEKIAKDAERNNALKDTQAEFDIFKANFDRYAADNNLAGNKYREEYEKQFSEFSNTISEKHKNYASDVALAAKGLFADNLGNVQAQGAAKWSKDLINQANEVARKDILSIQQNPANYGKGMLNIAEGVFSRVETGEVTAEYASQEVMRLGKEATIAAVDGYTLAKNYKAAKEFLMQEEVLNMLGAEDRQKLYEEVENKEYTDYNRQANMEDRTYNLKMRTLEENQNKQYANLLQTARLATTPEQLQLIEKDILKQAKTMGLTGAMAKGLLTQADDRYKEIDSQSDMQIAQQMVHISDVKQLDKIERSLVKMTASKQMLHDTGTKWFNVIRGMRSREKADPRVATLTKAYATRLKGYLPQPNVFGRFTNQNDAIRFGMVMSDYYIQVGGGANPDAAFQYAMKKHQNILTGAAGAGMFGGDVAGEYASPLGSRIQSFDDLNKYLLQIDKYKKDPIYSKEDIKKMEEDAYNIRNRLLVEEDMKKVFPGSELLDSVFQTPASQELSTPARSK